MVFSSALDCVFDTESGLPPDVSERTVAGLFGRHLEHTLRELRVAGGRWSVDCEYNRLGLDPKRVPQLDEMFADLAARLGGADDFASSATGLVVPDIVLHRRQSGVGAGNLIVCELKRIDASKQAIAAGRGCSIVRSKPGRGELRIQQALAAFVSALEGSSIPWMVIGGIAIIARGVRRMTADIDAVVQGDRTDVPSLLRILAKKRIVPRIDDAEAFVRESMVLLLRHDPTGVELDVSFAWTAFEHDAIEASTDATYGSVVAPMARAEDLVVFKAMAARPVDIEDASALLLMHKDIDLVRVRRRLGELAAMADEPALLVGLEQVIKRLASTSAADEVRRPRRPKVAASANRSPAGKTRRKTKSRKRSSS